MELEKERHGSRHLRRSDAGIWTLDEKLNMIHGAGFDGCGVRFFDYKYAKEITGFLRAHNMTWQAQCYPQNIDDLKPILEHVKELGARCLDAANGDELDAELAAMAR